MPAPHVGHHLRHPGKSSVLRGLGFGVAVVLAAVAIWLIVTSTSQKRIEIGILAGLWGLLLGAFSVFGSRHPQRVEVAAAPGQEVAVRAASDVERADDAAARRHFEARLEHMLRREIQTSMAREVSALRDEVAALRTELLDKVGGQLQLERIETTRVIGSDIEALQREINQLKGARLFGEPSQAPTVTRIASSRVLEPSVIDGHASGPEPMPARSWPLLGAPTSGALTSGAPDAGAPAASTERLPDPEAPSEPPPATRLPEPPGSAHGDGDPLAGLPRLPPFTDFELDPVEPTAPEPSYSGRRRADDPPTARRARHGADDDDGDEPGSGGRRRRADDDGHDVLARILQRESAR